MAILKIEPNVINTQAEFAFGNLTVAGNIEVGSTVIATTEAGDIAFNTATGGLVNGFVNGVKEVNGISVNTGYYGPLRIGAGYLYSGVAAPTALDAIQIFNSVLSDAQILEIYNLGKS